MQELCRGRAANGLPLKTEEGNEALGAGACQRGTLAGAVRAELAQAAAGGLGIVDGR